MLLCNYGAELEPWKARLIVSRAKRLGFAGHDLADAQQEVILDVLAFRFDESRSNGASEATALTSLIDRGLRAFRRCRVRYTNRIEKYASALGSDACETSTPQSLVMDVRDAVAGLSPEDRMLCTDLADGKTIRRIAAERGCSWSTVRREVARLQRHFEELGLDGWMDREEPHDGRS